MIRYNDWLAVIAAFILLSWLFTHVAEGYQQEAASAKQEAASAKQEAADTDKKLIGACADGLAKIYEQGKKEGYEAGVIFGKSNPRGL